ncbi:MAG: STAS domain-containing protein [Candidatus Acidiferrales bacterium]
MPRMDTTGFQVSRQAGTSAGVHVLKVRGALTSASAPAFQAAVEAVTEARLVIDMTEVPHVDSMAIGGLVRAYVACQKTKKRLAFVGMNHRVKNVLALTGVEELFDAYATVGEAEAAITQAN